MALRLTAASAPHLHGSESTRSMTGDVLVVVAFFLIAAIFYNGWRALTLTAVSVAACLLSEWAMLRLLGRRSEHPGLETAVTGIFIALCLPAAAPLWLPVPGAVFAIAVVKQLFGGAGRNLFNPAAAAVCLIEVSWPKAAGTFSIPFNSLPLFATPQKYETGVGILQALRAGSQPEAYNTVAEVFLGNTPSFMGTSCVLLLLIGGVYLLYRRIIGWQTPAAFLGVVALFALVLPRGAGARGDALLYELFSGGLLFAALFMATDPVTSPVTAFGRLVYGAGAGLLTVFLRRYGVYPEGAFFAVLLMNPFVLTLDRAAWRLNLRGKGAVAHASKA